MIIIARATSCGQALRLTTVRLEHNHDCTEEEFRADAKTRKLTQEEREYVSSE